MTWQVVEKKRRCREMINGTDGMGSEGMREGNGGELRDRTGVDKVRIKEL